MLRKLGGKMKYKKNNIHKIYLVLLTLIFLININTQYNDIIYADEASIIISKSEVYVKNIYFLIKNIDARSNEFNNVIKNTNVALDYIMISKRHLLNGEHESAKINAELSLTILEDIYPKAQELSVNNEMTKQNLLRNQILTAGIMIPLVIIFGSLCWKHINNYYKKQFMSKIPEVDKHEN